MSYYKLNRAEYWKEVEEAALVDQMCIRPVHGDRESPGANWEKAKLTWDTMKDQVCYFIVKKAVYPYNVMGYVRLFNTTPGNGYASNPTWVVDFMTPRFAEIAVLVADLLPGNVLVKGFFNTEPLSRHWPKIAVALAVPEAPYRIQTEKTSEWLVVIK